jgi:DNA repair protein RadC
MLAIKDRRPLLQEGASIHLKIQDWAESDRPREKLVQKGISSLTEAELLGILLGSGTKNISAVALAQNILKQHDNDLNELAKRSVKELQKFKGIGQAKAVAIVSAMELGRRREITDKTKKPKIQCSKDIYEIIKAELFDKVIEEFWILMVSRSSHLIKKQLISSGGSARLAVDPKVVFKTALDHHAAGIILIHNHPSGNPKPSDLDIQLTERLIKGGKLLGMPVLDHLIFTEKSYFSFADEDVLI